MEKGKLQNMIRYTEKKKNRTKQNKLNKQQKQTKKMQLYEMICKQTMRLLVKKGLNLAGRKQYTMALRPLRQSAIIHSLSFGYFTFGSAFKKP